MVQRVSIFGGDYNHIDTAGTYTLKTGPGILQSIAVNTPGDGTITVYDNVVGSGDKIAVVTTADHKDSIKYNAKFRNGLTVVVTGSTIGSSTISFT